MANTWVYGALEREPIRKEGGFLIPFTVVIEKGQPTGAYHCVPTDRRDPVNSVVMRRLFEQNPHALGKGLGVRDERVEFIDTFSPIELNRIASCFVEKVTPSSRSAESTAQLVVEFLTPQQTLNLLVRGESDNAPLHLIVSQQELEANLLTTKGASSTVASIATRIRAPPPMRNGILQPFPLTADVALDEPPSSSTLNTTAAHHAGDASLPPPSSSAFGEEGSRLSHCPSVSPNRNHSRSPEREGGSTSAQRDGSSTGRKKKSSKNSGHSTAVMFWWRADRPTTTVYPEAGSYEDGAAKWGYVAKRNVNTVGNHKLYPFQRGVTVDADGPHGLSQRVYLSAVDEGRVYKAAEFLINKLSTKGGGRPIVEARFMFRFVPAAASTPASSSTPMANPISPSGSSAAVASAPSQTPAYTTDLYFYHSPLLRRVSDVLEGSVKFLIPRQFQSGASFAVKNKGNHVGEEDLVHTPRLDVSFSSGPAARRGNHSHAVSGRDGSSVGRGGGGEDDDADDDGRRPSLPVKMRFLDERGMTAVQRQQEKKAKELAAKSVPKLSPCPDAPREHPEANPKRKAAIKRNNDIAYAKALIEALDGKKTIPLKVIADRLALSKRELKYLETLKAEHASNDTSDVVEMRAFSLDYQKEKGVRMRGGRVVYGGGASGMVSEHATLGSSSAKMTGANVNGHVGNTSTKSAGGNPTAKAGGGKKKRSGSSATTSTSANAAKASSSFSYYDSNAYSYYSSGAYSRRRAGPMAFGVGGLHDLQQQPNTSTAAGNASTAKRAKGGGAAQQQSKRRVAGDARAHQNTAGGGGGGSSAPRMVKGRRSEEGYDDASYSEHEGDYNESNEDFGSDDDDDAHAEDDEFPAPSSARGHRERRSIRSRDPSREGGAHRDGPALSVHSDSSSSPSHSDDNGAASSDVDDSRLHGINDISRISATAGSTARTKKEGAPSLPSAICVSQRLISQHVDAAHSHLAALHQHHHHHRSAASGGGGGDHSLIVTSGTLAAAAAGSSSPPANSGRPTINSGSNTLAASLVPLSDGPVPTAATAAAQYAASLEELPAKAFIAHLFGCGGDGEVFGAASGGFPRPDALRQLLSDAEWAGVGEAVLAVGDMLEVLSYAVRSRTLTAPISAVNAKKTAPAAAADGGGGVAGAVGGNDAAAALLASFAHALAEEPPAFLTGNNGNTTVPVYGGVDVSFTGIDSSYGGSPSASASPASAHIAAGASPPLLSPPPFNTTASSSSATPAAAGAALVAARGGRARLIGGSNVISGTAAVIASLAGVCVGGGATSSSSDADVLSVFSIPCPLRGDGAMYCVLKQQQAGGEGEEEEEEGEGGDHSHHHSHHHLASLYPIVLAFVASLDAMVGKTLLCTEGDVLDGVATARREAAEEAARQQKGGGGRTGSAAAGGNHNAASRRMSLLAARRRSTVAGGLGLGGDDSAPSSATTNSALLEPVWCSAVRRCLARNGYPLPLYPSPSSSSATTAFFMDAFDCIEPLLFRTNITRGGGGVAAASSAEGDGTAAPSAKTRAAVVPAVPAISTAASHDNADADTAAGGGHNGEEETHTARVMATREIVQQIVDGALLSPRDGGGGIVGGKDEATAAGMCDGTSDTHANVEASAASATSEDAAPAPIIPSPSSSSSSAAYTLCEYGDAFPLFFMSNNPLAAATVDFKIHAFVKGVLPKQAIRLAVEEAMRRRRKTAKGGGGPSTAVGRAANNATM